MLGYLSSKLTVLFELRSQKTVRFSEEIISADKYPGIFSHQAEASYSLHGIHCSWMMV